MFAIQLKKHYWINDSIDDFNDLCLHGDIAITIGEEHFETSCTISATALYLLRTLTENHVLHKDNQIFPCCGHFYIPNDTNDTVHISGCPNGIDLSIIRTEDNIEITTDQCVKTFIDANTYSKVVCDFADEIQSIYAKCSPKKVPSEDFNKKGYVSFWNEWTRRRNSFDSGYFCPAISRTIDIGLCWEYCFVDSGAPMDTEEMLKKWIKDNHIFKSIKDFQTVCQICSHCQWPR